MRISKLLKDRTIPDGIATEHSLACWKKDVELELGRMGFGITGVDAKDVFYHTLQGWPKPKKQLRIDQQRNLLVKAMILDPSSAETPKEDTKDNSDTEHELRKFFLWDADFQNYNEQRMTANDPNAYKWSTGKKLFDYTPHVTKEDWLHALAHERYKESMRNAKLRERYGKDRNMLRSLQGTYYNEKSPVWEFFSSDEVAWAFNPEAWRAIEPPAPYEQFLDNDWCRYCLWPRYAGLDGRRRPKNKDRDKLYDMSYYWSVRPEYLLWVGGTYARHPKHFPANQQDTEWIFANLRPLCIQPPTELMRIHFAKPWKRSPDWPAPGYQVIQKHDISIEACGAQLYNYLKLHAMISYRGDPDCVWYGHALPYKWFDRDSLDFVRRPRTKAERNSGSHKQPPAAALDHPEMFAITYNSLLLPFAKRLDQMPQVDRAATEHVVRTNRVNRRSSDGESSADTEDEYGTLA